jgi:ABC-type sugar transport system substrate-binding protein
MLAPRTKPRTSATATARLAASGTPTRANASRRTDFSSPAELLQYPPQFKIGFMSNNPPVNDVMPEVKMGAKEWLKEHGFGRLTL